MRISPLLLLACLCVTACDIELDVFADEYWFNNKLRADAEALSSSQLIVGEDPRTPFEPLLISDGGPQRGEIVTDISLTRTGEFAAAPLHNTTCLWLAPADEMKIHWETVNHVTYIGEKDITLDPARSFSGFCSFSHPYTREWIADDEGNEYPWEDNGAEPFATVEVNQRVLGDYGAFFNEYDECMVPPSGLFPAAATTACPGAFGSYQDCNPTGCGFAVERDVQFELSNVVDGTTMNTKTLEPLVKRVSGTRQLVRPLQFDGTLNEFGWSVRELPDGRWSENFSTNLRLTSVRVFGLLPSGQRVYLDPDTGRISGVPCGSVAMADDFSLRCNGVDPATQLVNPAYFHLTPDQRIYWGVSFRNDPRDGGFTTSCCEGTQEQCCDGGVCPPLCSQNEVAPYGKLDEQLYIEFTLIDLANAAPDLFSSPSALEFGPVEWGASWRQQVSIKNTGGTALDLDHIGVRFASYDAFEVELPPSVHLPMTLAAGDYIVVDVVAASGEHAREPEGELLVTAKDPSGGVVESTTALRYRPYTGPLVYDLFGHIDVTGGEMHFCEDAWAQSVLVENIGDRDFVRGAYEVVGDDAGSFRIEPWGHGVTLDPTTLAPGEADVVRVTFEPDPAGNYEQRAELVATGNARNTPDGDVRIPLVGFLDSWENQPGCYPHAVQGG